MSLRENQPVSSRGFSVRSMLFLGLLLGVGAGATEDALGIAMGAVLSVPSGVKPRLIDRNQFQDRR